MGSLAVLSTCVGGAIVSLPWCMYQLGIPLGIFVNIMSACAIQYTNMLYLDSKDNIPLRVTTIYEVSYVCLNRFGIYLISVLQLVMAAGLNIIYFMVFADAAASLVVNYYPNSGSFFATRTFYIICLGLAEAYPLLQKELKEIKAVSVILFVSIALFLVLMTIQLALNSA